MVGASSSSISPWLQILLGEKFFSPCLVHESAKKNDKNIFCLDCRISICLHCLTTHRPHHLLQVRRYVYHDVIRLDDAQKLMNCSFVQPYTANSAKVVFLHKRPMTRPFKSSGNFCMNCDRTLQHSYLFCSVSCKIHHLVTSKSGIINKSFVSLFGKGRRVSLSDLEDAAGQMTPDSILDSPAASPRTFACTAAVESVKKKKRNVVLKPPLSRQRCSTRTGTVESVKKKKRNVGLQPPLFRQKCSTTNRRKSVPHRAPLN